MAGICFSTCRGSIPAARTTVSTVFSCVASRNKRCVSHSQMAGSTPIGQPLPHPQIGLTQPIAHRGHAGPGRPEASRSSTARRRLKREIVKMHTCVLTGFPKARRQTPKPCDPQGRAGRSHPRRRPATRRSSFPASLAPARSYSATLNISPARLGDSFYFGSSPKQLNRLLRRRRAASFEPDRTALRGRRPGDPGRTERYYVSLTGLLYPILCRVRAPNLRQNHSKRRQRYKNSPKPLFHRLTTDCTSPQNNRTNGRNQNISRNNHRRSRQTQNSNQ